MFSWLTVWYLLGPIVSILGTLLTVRFVWTVLGVSNQTDTEGIFKIEFPETDTQVEHAVLLLWAFFSFVFLMSIWYLALPQIIQI